MKKKNQGSAPRKEPIKNKRLRQRDGQQARVSGATRHKAKAMQLAAEKKKVKGGR